MVRVLLLIVFSSFILTAQQYGVISGYVSDNATEIPLVGANVLIVGTDTGAATDADGEFIITAVPVGIYNLRVTVIGYEPFIKTDVVVSSGRPARIKVKLFQGITELGEISADVNNFLKPSGKAVSTQTQSYEEIRRLPGGSEDVVKAISILPGVAQVQAGRNDLIVRGGAPSENLYVLDGVEIPNINHFGTQGAAGGPLSYINLDFVESTIFSSGGFGPQYGDRLSSVLTINLREGRTDRIGGKATIAATQFGFNIEGPISDNSEFLLSARRSYLDFIFKAAGFGFVPEYWDFLNKISWRLSPRDRLTLLGIVVLDNVKFFNDEYDQILSNSTILGSDQTQYIGALNYRRLVQDGYFNLALSHINTNFNYLQSDTLLNPIFENDSNEDQTELKADLTHKFSPRTRLSVGSQIKTINFSAGLKINSDLAYGNQDLNIDSQSDTTAFKGAVYFQISHRFSSIDFKLGARMDYFNLIDVPFEFSPRFSAVYKYSPTLNFTASIGRFHQSPAYIWLASNPDNARLRMIRTDQFILGADYYLRQDIKISLEAYYKNYNHYAASLIRPYLLMVNTGAGWGGEQEGFASFGTDPLVSDGKGWSRGIELFIQKKLSYIPLYGTFTASYSQAKFKALDGISRPGSFDQNWIFNLGGGYILNAKWEFSAKFRFSTGRPYTPLDDQGELLTDQYNTLRTDNNHSLDMRVDRRFNFKTRVLILYMDIQNVYNNVPKDAPVWDPETNSIRDDEQLGLLPSIGISLEF